MLRGARSGSDPISSAYDAQSASRFDRHDRVAHVVFADPEEERPHAAADRVVMALTGRERLRRDVRRALRARRRVRRDRDDRRGRQSSRRHCRTAGVSTATGRGVAQRGSAATCVSATV